MKPIFQKNLQFWDIWPRNPPQIAQIEVFGHFLDFALLVFLTLHIMIGGHDVYLFSGISPLQSMYSCCAGILTIIRCCSYTKQWIFKNVSVPFKKSECFSYILQREWNNQPTSANFFTASTGANVTFTLIQV